MTPEQFEEIYKTESRKVHATLVRLLQDLDLAEEASQEAFAAAFRQWPESGIPKKPGAWLVSTGRFKAIDIIRRRSKLQEYLPQLILRADEIQAAHEERVELDVSDDRLRLIFTCCHPAIDPKVQVPLTLREVCGLTTNEVAKAFLTRPNAMAQRIVRGKNKIRLAKIPFSIPSVSDLPDRLDSVLKVIYLIFNEGYSTPTGLDRTRSRLAEEAIRLGRLMMELLPDPEVIGLLSLMLLHESRRPSRFTQGGDIILLRDQDRSRWNQAYIKEGTRLLKQSTSDGEIGSYGLQAAISAVHAGARSYKQTDWKEIVSLYSLLLKVEASPVVELNMAVAIAMRDGPGEGLLLVENILDKGQLLDYPLAHTARAEFLKQLGRPQDALSAFQQALELTDGDSEKRFLLDQISEL